MALSYGFPRLDMEGEMPYCLVSWKYARVNDEVSDFHSNFLHDIVGGSWPVRRPGDKVTSPCVALSYRGKSLENFTGEIQAKKFTAVPLAAWDGGFLSFFKIAPQ